MKLELDNSEKVFRSELQKLSKNDFSNIKKQFKDESNEEKYKQILGSLELLVEGQKVTQKDLQLGFIGLAKQNSELLDFIKKEHQQKLDRKKASLKRKRLSKRQPITPEIY